MHTLFGKRIHTRLLLLIIALALTGCKASTSHDDAFAPTEGSLVINPNATTISGAGTAVGCAGLNNGAPFVVSQYVISTFDAQGRPFGNADIGISLDFAENTIAIGDPVLTELLDGGVVSSAGLPVVYETTTDDKGNKTVFVRYEFSPGSGCVYSGNMTVTSGSLVELMEFDIAE